jgi:hypothetical protein
VGFRRGVSEVPHGVPMIGSRSMLAVRYGDTTAMSADGRLRQSSYDLAFCKRSIVVAEF